MAYKVRVQGTGTRRLKRDYGTGGEGKGGAYQTRKGAEERAKKLRKEFPTKKGFTVSVARVRDSVLAY